MSKTRRQRGNAGAPGTAGAGSRAAAKPTAQDPSTQWGESGGQGRSSTALILGGIMLVGLLLRVAYLSEIVSAPDFEFPALDAAFHDYWARALATGDWSPPQHFPDPEIQHTPFFRPPGYPYFLALVYKFAGHNYLAARVAQMALGLVNCLLAYRLGRAVLGSSVGLVFAAMMSCYGVFIYFEGELLAPVLSVLLVLILVNLLTRWVRKTTYANTFAAGWLLALFALTLPNALILAPLVLVWAAWLARRRRASHSFRIPLVGFTLGVVAGIIPATLRNYGVARDAVLITSNAGVNLYIGNNERADGSSAGIPILEDLTGLSAWTCFDQPAIAHGVEKLEGRPLKASEVSAFFTRRAFKYIQAHPGRVLKLMAQKALLFWGPTEITNHKVTEVERQNSPTLRWLPGWPGALSLALLGLGYLGFGLRAASPRRSAGAPQREVVILVFVLVGAYFASFLPFFIADRFRIPVVPFLLLFGAYGFCRIGGLLADRRWPAAALVGSVGVLLYAGARQPWVKYEPDVEQWHFDRADTYCRRGEWELALREYQEALEVSPQPSPRSYNDLGAVLLQQQRYAEAAAHFESALRLQPDYVQARLNLTSVLLAEGKPLEALPHLEEVVRKYADHGQARYNLGTLLLRQERFADAIPHLREAVRLDPENLYAHTHLAQVLQRLGRRVEAEQQYLAVVPLAAQAIAKAETSDPALLDTLATAYHMTGDHARAVETQQQAIAALPREESPQRWEFERRLVQFLLAQGDTSGADQTLRQAVDRSRRVLGDTNLLFLKRLVQDGAFLSGAGRHAWAEPLWREALAACRRTLPEGNWLIVHAQTELGGCLTELGRYPEAEPLLVNGYAAMAAVQAPLENQRQVLHWIVKLYEVTGRPDQAASWRAKLLEPSPPPSASAPGTH